MATDKVKNRLFKDIVNPVWEGFYVWGHGWPGWPERYGQFKNSTEVYAPIREIYGPVGAYYGDNGAMAGAYAAIYDNPYDNRAKVTYVMSNMISEYGASAFTHETTTSMTVLPTLEIMVVVKEQTLKLMPKVFFNPQLLRGTKGDPGP